MATINLTEGTHLHKSPERIKLEKCRKALMKMVPKDGSKPKAKTVKEFCDNHLFELYERRY